MTAMWTIGREREKEHARRFLGVSKESSLIEAVIDAVHDLLESGIVIAATRAAFTRGFVDGGNGTWESTGSWLAKSVRKFPELSSLWLEFGSHSSTSIRFRAAAFLKDMPEETALAIFPVLLSDKSARVRSKVAGEQHDSQRAWVAPLLVERRTLERDPSVIASIDFALDSLRNRTLILPPPPSAAGA
jgi:hypothetical protein